MTVSFSAEATLSALSIDGSSVVKSEPACPDDMYETSQLPRDVYETSQLPRDVYETSQLPRYTEIKTELPEDIEVDSENHSPKPNNLSHDTQVYKYVEKMMKLTNIQCYQNNSALVCLSITAIRLSLCQLLVYLVISCLLFV